MGFTERMRHWARRIKRDGVTLWFACRDARTPMAVKALCVLVVAYALSPIDLIPDFIPVLGYLDDVLLLPGLIWLAVRLLPPAVLDDSRALPPVAHEPTGRSGLKHRDGTLSVARSAPGTGGGAAFFICIGDQPALDFGGHRNLDGQGFAAFGVVTGGMDIVRAIQRSPVTAQALTPPVQILQIRRGNR